MGFKYVIKVRKLSNLKGRNRRSCLMRKKEMKVHRTLKIKIWILSVIGSFIGATQLNQVEARQMDGSHLGTFSGTTIYATQSQNGVNPGLWLEVMDDDGKVTQYESEGGIIVLPNTEEGTYVTQAKFLGKTVYIDQDTGEQIDVWEEGRSLKLASVESPSLKVIGKNLLDLFDEDKLCVYAGGRVVNENHKNIYRVDGTTVQVVNQGTFANHLGYKLPLEGIENLTISGEGLGQNLFYRFFGEGFTELEGQGQKSKGYSKDSSGRKYVTLRGEEFPTNAEYIFLGIGDHSVSNYTMKNLQIEINTSPTPYLPYQSTVVSVEDSVRLYKTKNHRDELDLIQGETEMWTDEAILNGNENWVWRTEFNDNPDYLGCHLVHTGELGNSEDYFLENFDYLGKVSNFEKEFGNREGFFRYSGAHHIYLALNRNRLEEQTLAAFKKWLKDNPLNIRYEAKTPTQNEVALISDYQFPKSKIQNLQLTGTIEPLLVSITVPSESLDFVLDPNQEKEQQFIAPELVLRNETYAPLQVELRTFEQVTDVLVDVLPDKYEDWDNLNRRQSEHMALSLNPLFSDQWLTLNEVPYYVANTSNAKVGTLKGNSEVAFEFKALHGQSFSEVLRPTYRIVFVFDYLT